MTSFYLTALVCAVLTGCAVRHTPATGTVPITPANSGFKDLEPGWRLRVVTPILKSGGYRLQPSTSQASGNTVTLSADSDFLGYEVAYYEVRARSVRFLSAEVTRDGKTVPQTQPLVRLFDLPRGIRHVRLIYMLRVSQADHDMAVAAARDMAALEALTARLTANPAEACRSDGNVACAWIPAGIAVVPEMRKTADSEEWVPAR